MTQATKMNINNKTPDGVTKPGQLHRPAGGLDDVRSAASSSSPDNRFAISERQRVLARVDRASKRRHAQSGSAADAGPLILSQGAEDGCPVSSAKARADTWPPKMT
jgi:hypothetical protein